MFNLDFSNFNIVNFIVVMFAFLFVDLFDTLGTLIGVASKADMLDEDGRLPNIKGALMADSIGTCWALCWVLPPPPPSWRAPPALPRAAAPV